MFSNLQNPLSLIARLMMVLLFLPAGIGKIGGFAGTVGYIASVGLPFATLGAVIAIVVEVAGSLALLAGFQTRLAAFILAVFALVSGLFFHQFWAAAPDQAMLQQIMFFKNVAITGGLLMLSAFGAGGWSLDARRGA